MDYFLEVFDRISLRAFLVGWAMILGGFALPLVLATLLAKPDQLDPKRFWGCYTLEGAPSLEIRPSEIVIHQSGVPKLTYQLESWKPAGWALLTRPPWRLTKLENARYQFQRDNGEGYFWPFVQPGRKGIRYLHKGADFAGMIEIVADDRQVIYSKQPDNSKCQAA